MTRNRTFKATGRGPRMGGPLAMLCVLSAAGILLFAAGCGTEVSGRVVHRNGDTEMATATFAAGCFWGVEAAFRQVEGVTATEVGYTGGHAEDPTYRQVCSGTTGHSEAVRVEFDPGQVSYEELLDVFWDSHDPTSWDRQGPDVGQQYRSIIFYHTPEQKAAAEASKDALEASGEYDAPVVTQIRSASTFWRAEEYHQQYLEKQGGESCHL